jgi:NADP-dependent 3-hydroxy acid dehydrogenase YdfG
MTQSLKGTVAQVTGTSSGIGLPRPQDVADAVSYAVTRDRWVAVIEMLARSAEQPW